jgi:threonyl-tRNA synthetase
MKNLTKKQVKEYVRIHTACQTLYLGFNCEQEVGENDVENIEAEIQRVSFKNLRGNEELITTTDEVLNYVREHFKISL